MFGSLRVRRRTLQLITIPYLSLVCYRFTQSLLEALNDRVPTTFSRLLVTAQRSLHNFWNHKSETAGDRPELTSELQILICSWWLVGVGLVLLSAPLALYFETTEPAPSAKQRRSVGSKVDAEAEKAKQQEVGWCKASWRWHGNALSRGILCS